MTVMNVQAIALSGLGQLVLSTAFERDRPAGVGCATDPEYSRFCAADNRYKSFFSGHTAIAVSGASLTCLHHTRLRIYGDPGDTIACASAIAFAGATGILRIVAEAHYATDVLTGAAVGLL